MAGVPDPVKVDAFGLKANGDAEDAEKEKGLSSLDPNELATGFSTVGAPNEKVGVAGFSEVDPKENAGAAGLSVAGLSEDPKENAGAAGLSGLSEDPKEKVGAAAGLSEADPNVCFSAADPNEKVGVEDDFSVVDPNVGLSAAEPNVGLAGVEPNDDFSDVDPNAGFSKVDPNAGVDFSAGFSEDAPNVKVGAGLGASDPNPKGISGLDTGLESTGLKPNFASAGLDSFVESAPKLNTGFSDAPNEKLAFGVSGFKTSFGLKASPSGLGVVFSVALNPNVGVSSFSAVFSTAFSNVFSNAFSIGFSTLFGFSNSEMTSLYLSMMLFLCDS